eukprot:jgi/Ulvmu1/5045/UM021_0062.1
MTRAKKAAANAVLNTWKFQKGDKVMIARGRNRGRVATITGVVRDGNTAAGRGRPIPKHKKDRWKTNPKVFLGNRSNAGRRVLRGNRSIETDRPIPLSNVCHVHQASDKSSYECVRVEFQGEGSEKRRIAKVGRGDEIELAWTKKERPPPRKKSLRNIKYATADVAHQRTYFPPAKLTAPVGRRISHRSQHQTMYNTPSDRGYSTFASQVQRHEAPNGVDICAGSSDRPLHSWQGLFAQSEGEVWDQLMQLQREASRHCT